MCTLKGLPREDTSTIRKIAAHCRTVFLRDAEARAHTLSPALETPFLQSIGIIRFYLQTPTLPPQFEATSTSSITTILTHYPTRIFGRPQCYHDCSNPRNASRFLPKGGGMRHALITSDGQNILPITKSALAYRASTPHSAYKRCSPGNRIICLAYVHLDFSSVTCMMLRSRQ